MSTPEELLRGANTLIQQGNRTKARGLLGRCLDKFPEQVDAYQLLAMIEVQDGNLEAAGKHAEAYLKRRPADAGGWYNLGFIRQQQQQWQAALGAYRKARELNPGHLPTAVNLAQVMEQLGNRDAAVACLDEALATDPGQPAAANALAAMHLREGRHALARSVLEAASTREPRNPLTWMNLGIALTGDGLPEEAVSAYRRALDLRPDYVAARLNLAKALTRAGDSEAALGEIDRGLADNPGDGAFHAARAVVLDRLGRADEALAAARTASELMPHDANAWYNLASMLSKLTDGADLRAAEGAARSCLTVEPRHAAAHHCLAIVLAKRGRMADALQHARRAVELDPDAPHQVTLGDLLVGAGQLPDALAVLRDASRRHPRAPPPRRQLGVALLKARHPRQALAELERALALDPGDQRGIAHRAVALQQLGRDAEANAYLGLHEHVYAQDLACPAGFADLAAFNRQLAHDIRNHSRLRWEPIGLAARNGGLTDDLLADRTPAIVGFHQSLRSAIDHLRSGLKQDPRSPFLRSIPGAGYRLNSWATLVAEAGHIDTHIHEESWLSGAYYVELPDGLGSTDSDPAGWIEFGRPHQTIPFPPDADTRLLRPYPGLLLLFPSYLFHRTIPHRGSQQRISISFDLSQPAPQCDGRLLQG